jgi:hypothetical protein
MGGSPTPSGVQAGVAGISHASRVAYALDTVHPRQDADLFEGADRLVIGRAGAASSFGDRLLEQIPVDFTHSLHA